MSAGASREGRGCLVAMGSAKGRFEVAFYSGGGDVFNTIGLGDFEADFDAPGRRIWKRKLGLYWLEEMEGVLTGDGGGHCVGGSDCDGHSEWN